jgi:hypothetical protein
MAEKGDRWYFHLSIGVPISQSAISQASKRTAAVGGCSGEKRCVDVSEDAGN